MTQPYGISIDREGSLFISEFGGRRIQKFTAAGELASGGWGEGVTGREGCCAAEGSAFDRDGNLYVTDNVCGHVRKFAPDGALLLDLAVSDEGTGQKPYPSDVAIDSKGNLYVVAWGLSRIQKYGFGPEVRGGAGNSD